MKTTFNSKRAMSLLLLMMACAVAQAQISIDWQQCYGSNKADLGFSMAETPEGLLVLGWSDTYTAIGMCNCNNSIWNDEATWLFGLDDEHQITSQYCDEPGSSGEIHPSSDGRYYITEIANDFMRLELRITCVDAMGNVIWKKYVGPTEYEGYTFHGFFGSHGIATADGGLVIMSGIQDFYVKDSTPYGGVDGWVIKLDSEGNVVWKTLLGTAGDDQPICITATSDGGVLLGLKASTSGGGNIGDVPSDKPNVLAKLDADGTLLWTRCYAGIVIQKVLALEDGYLLAGQKNIRNMDCCLVRCDAEGNVVWMKTYGGSEVETTHAVFSTGDNGFTVFANSNSLDGDLASAAALGVTGDETCNVWVFHTDAEGTLLWERCIGSQLGLRESVSGVISLHEGEYVMVGTVSWFDGDSSGNISCSNNSVIPNSGLNVWVAHLTEGTTETEEVPSHQTSIVPNPTRGMVEVTGNGIRQAVAYNNLGQRVAIGQGDSDRLTLDLSNQPTGVYFISVTLDNGDSYTDKIVKQ